MNDHHQHFARYYIIYFVLYRILEYGQCFKISFWDVKDECVDISNFSMEFYNKLSPEISRVLIDESGDF